MMICKKTLSKLGFRGKDLFLLLFVTVLGALAIWSFYKWDQQIFSLLRKNPVDWDDNFWIESFTYLGKAWLPIWLALIWYVVKRNQRPVLIVLLALILTLLTVIPVKVATRRPRPREVIEMEQMKEQDPDLDSHTSFPSGDTAAICAVSIVIVYLAASFPRACFLLVVCTGVAMLRVTAMAHYVSDVFAGAAAGSLAGWAAIQIDKRWLVLERGRFELKSGTAVLAIVAIPISVFFSEGIHTLVVFVMAGGMLTVYLYLVTGSAGKLLGF
ncbi:MAG: phosphatase PAP2 family protein [Planctomycetota bacterium]|jgi:membrane-associated phospholipid phosphatase